MLKGLATLLNSYHLSTQSSESSLILAGVSATETWCAAMERIKAPVRTTQSSRLKMIFGLLGSLTATQSSARENSPRIRSVGLFFKFTDLPIQVSCLNSELWEITWMGLEWSSSVWTEFVQAATRSGLWFGLEMDVFCTMWSPSMWSGLVALAKSFSSVMRAILAPERN